MKVIRDLNATVTYKVGLRNAIVSDMVFEQLDKMAKYGLPIEDNKSEEYKEAFEWLTKYINEYDSCSLSYKVEFEEYN